MIYFSDKYENTEYVSTSVWNGIISLYNELIAANYFAKSFPETCPDNGLVYTVNIHNLENAIKAEIPQITIPIQSIKTKALNPFEKSSEHQEGIKLSILVDLIEFMFGHLSNPKNIEPIHKYMNHFHLQFDLDLKEIKNYFLDKVNTIFKRNSLPYFITEKGCVERIVDDSIVPLIEKEQFYTHDKTLNSLLNKAFKMFKSSKLEERRDSLDVLWDAYEQLKTQYGSDKQVKQSIETIIDSVSFSHIILKEAISKDADEMNSVGNRTDIRHKNTGVEAIANSKHVDYLFFRMSNLIHLLLQHFEVNNGQQQ